MEKLSSTVQFEIWVGYRREHWAKSSAVSLSGIVGFQPFQRDSNDKNKRAVSRGFDIISKTFLY